ncbi:hypothetical protein J500_1076 [Acinetobacter sp. 479375]|nr:hypothetical protein J500_1076 [Acinetobacter sp. 479375]
MKKKFCIFKENMARLSKKCVEYWKMNKKSYSEILIKK